MVAEVMDMAKSKPNRKGNQEVPGEEKTKLTTFRVSKATGQKISELATLRQVSIHKLVDDMFSDLLDAALIEAMQPRLEELRRRTGQ